MPRYQKKPTVVEAFQSGSQQNLGALGSLITNDWIIKSVEGTLTTLSNTDFTEKFNPAPASAELTGDDVN